MKGDIVLVISEYTIVSLIAGVLVLLTVAVFAKPIRFILRLLINTALGFAALLLINYLGAGFGISLGVNWVNAAVTGILGLPGVALLLILKYLAVL